MQIRKHMIVHGKVQGVGFRHTAYMLARALELYGSVQNLENGDVELYLQGEAESIEEYMKRLNRYSHIRIESVECKEEACREESGFQIIITPFRSKS